MTIEIELDLLIVEKHLIAKAVGTVLGYIIKAISLIPIPFRLVGVEGIAMLKIKLGRTSVKIPAVVVGMAEESILKELVKDYLPLFRQFQMLYHKWHYL